MPVPVPKISRKHLKEQSLEQGFVIQRAGSGADKNLCVPKRAAAHGEVRRCGWAAEHVRVCKNTIHAKSS